MQYQYLYCSTGTYSTGTVVPVPAAGVVSYDSCFYPLFYPYAYRGLRLDIPIVSISGSRLTYSLYCSARLSPGPDARHVGQGPVEAQEGTGPRRPQLEDDGGAGGEARASPGRAGQALHAAAEGDACARRSSGIAAAEMTVLIGIGLHQLALLLRPSDNAKYYGFTWSLLYDRTSS